MSAVEWKVPVGSEEVSAAYGGPTEEAGPSLRSGRQGDGGSPHHTIFVCAHGAGGNISDRSTLATAKAMQKHGIGVVRFNFLYKEKGRGGPDKMPKLLDTFGAVVADVRREFAPKKLIIGGRSMGGRAASMLAADGFDANGLLLLAYPLHPPGQPEKLRVDHLPNIKMPVLAFSGTRDPFVTRELMDQAIASTTAPWEMHWVETADHSFHVQKSSGKSDAEVMDDIARTSAEWVAQR